MTDCTLGVDVAVAYSRRGLLAALSVAPGPLRAAAPADGTDRRSTREKRRAASCPRI